MQLSAEWSVNAQYNYGWFVPLFAVYLFWLRWQDPPEPEIDPSLRDEAAEREFVKRVRERGVSCTVRDTRGREIAAACGQLAAEG